MAIYRFESRILGRNQGHTSVGYAAYLTAQKLHDERYDETRDFTRKRQADRIYHSQIVAPETAPDWVHDREKLWNKTEHAEKRKDAQVAREIHVALPTELTHAEKVTLGLKFARQEYVEKGMVADVSFHNFDGVGSHNPHAHILLTTRRLEGDGFASKKEDTWRPKIARDPATKRSIVDPDFLKEERGTWERYCNDALKQAGQDQRVDCRSLKDRGIDRTPQPKLGKAHYMEQREEWKGKTIAGEVWREAQHLNALKDEQKALAREQAALLQEIRVESVKQAFEVGQELAREEQNSRQQPSNPPSATTQQPSPKPFREPWKRDWEHEHQTSQERRKRRQQRRDRQERVQRKEQERHTLKQQHSDSEAPPATQDERELLRQWLEYKDRERDKPCSGGDRHHGAEPEQGNSQEQQLAKLKEEMAAFDADDPPQPPPEPKQTRKPRR